MTLPTLAPPPLLTPDRSVRVFISSTLGELKAERQAVMQAVRELHLTPIYFEEGARPQSAQDIYRAWLAQSDVFIGIYARSYGWVGPGMSISGLEDEWQLSKSLPRLAYVKDVPQGERQAELDRLLTEVGEAVKYYPFRAPDDLAAQVKKDLMALLSERFFHTPELSPAHDTSFGFTPVPSLRPAPDPEVIDRPEVLALLASSLSPGSSLVMTGGPGSGKTTLLKQFAQGHMAAYISLEHKTPLQALLTAGATIAALRGENPELATTEEAATAVVQAQLLKGPVTLLIDQVDGASAAAKALLGLSLGAGQAIYAANVADRTVFGSTPTLVIPPLAQDEVEALLDKGGRSLPPGELIALMDASRGNPLYLRYYLASRGGDFPANLGAFEDVLWAQMAPPLQELVGLVALSRVDLNAEDLAGLLRQRGQHVTAMGVVQLANTSHGLLRFEHRAARVFHPHFAQYVSEQFASSGAAHSLHALLADVALARSSMAAAAFHLREAGDPRLGDHLKEGGRAAFLMGDWPLAADLFERAEAQAISGENLGEAGLAAYDLAVILSGLAHREQAEAAIDRAIQRFEEADYDLNALAARIYRSTLWVKSGRAGSGITELERTRDKIVAFEQVDPELLATCEVNLSYSYKHVGRFAEARAAAERAAEIFARSGNQEGEYSAITNAAASAVQLDDLDAALALTERLQEGGESRPRMEAARQNLLTIIYRKRDEPERAEGHARQAVRLAKRLGSPELEAMNLNALGNTLIDQERRQEAQAAYLEALAVARRSGDINQEGHSLELLSRLPLDAGDYESARELAEQALEIHERQSDHVRIATTGEKLGEAYGHLGRWSDAAQTFETSARAFLPDLVESSGNTWFRAALAWTEIGDLLRALRALRSGSATFLEEDAGLLPEVDNLEDLNGLLGALGALAADEEGHFLAMAAHCVMRAAMVGGSVEAVEVLLSYLTENAIRGGVKSNNVLAEVLTSSTLSDQQVRSLEQQLLSRRANLHKHENAEFRIYTVGVRSAAPFIVQLSVLGEGPHLRGLGLSLALLLSGNEGLFSEVQEQYGVKDARDGVIHLTSDLEEELPADLAAMVSQRSVVTLISPDDVTDISLLVSGATSIWTSSGLDKRARGYTLLGLDLSTVLAGLWGLEGDEAFARTLVFPMLP